MKVPPKRKGNLANALDPFTFYQALNESPSEKEGKYRHYRQGRFEGFLPLNESPSEKEGKYKAALGCGAAVVPSMKVPPKRKGNADAKG